MRIQEQMAAALDKTAHFWGVKRADLCFMARPALIHALRRAGIVAPAPIYPDTLIPEEHTSDGRYTSDIHVALRCDGRVIARQRPMMRRKLWRLVMT